ncbi:hypothetical protein AQUCO_06800017v1 [Aquilegia coerulea]|uniref:Uncharacterized protein n=1 Tax=Aquilegia coerulea TaxID=218851 RepID=A0A2G5CBB7_AQUCA|nr:hypothetical protein AQUCO_06800017v1 [Aquilegia coerulea]
MYEEIKFYYFLDWNLSVIFSINLSGKCFTFEHLLLIYLLCYIMVVLVPQEKTRKVNTRQLFFVLLFFRVFCKRILKM